MQLEREGRSWCTVREGGAGTWSWCTVREGGARLVYSYRERGGAGVQLESREGGVELVYSWRGWSWCTAGEGGVELVYS